MGLTEVIENDFQDTPYDNSQKNLKYEKPSYEKNGEYHILGRNSNFRENSGILQLEMSHPDPTPWMILFF